MTHKTGGIVFRAALFAVIAALIVVFLPATRAFGFQQTMTCNEAGGDDPCQPGESARALHWSARCVRYQVSEDALGQVATTGGKLATMEEIRRVVARSFATWNRVDCSDLTIVDGGVATEDQTPTTGRQTNLVRWRDLGWEQLASARAFAVTSVTFKPKTGRIIRADIELNTELYAYSLSDNPLPNHVDLQNTMTHEVGHFVGLDHSDLKAATMFPTASLGETSKRRLHPDDIAGFCAIYPAQHSTSNPSAATSQYASPPQNSTKCIDDSEFPTEESLNLNNASCALVIPAKSSSTSLLNLLIIMLFGAFFYLISMYRPPPKC